MTDTEALKIAIEALETIRDNAGGMAGEFYWDEAALANEAKEALEKIKGAE